jgi:hypothetical protein
MLIETGFKFRGRKRRKVFGSVVRLPGKTER